MALNFAAVLAKRRTPIVSAIRSFPPRCGPNASSAALRPTSVNLTSDRNVTPMKPNLQSDLTSCGPGSNFLSRRGKIRRPVVFAVRHFPKGCGPRAAAIPKPSPSMEASAVVVRGVAEEERIAEEGSGLDKIMEDVVERSLSEKDLQKPNGKISHISVLVEGNGELCRPESSELKNEVEEREEKLNDLVKRITEEPNGLDKTLKNAEAGISLGEKDGEKPIRKSLSGSIKDGRRFNTAVTSESKKESNDTVRIISDGRSGSGKKVEKAPLGRSLGEKDDRKPIKKRPLMPYLVEGGKLQMDQLVDPRNGRLVVQALMASERSPWMQGKRKGSTGSQSRSKKPRVR